MGISIRLDSSLLPALFRFLIAFSIAARRKGTRPMSLCLVHVPSLRAVRLIMWVAGVAYGFDSLDVTRLKRNLRFFLCTLFEASPSTSVSCRLLLSKFCGCGSCTNTGKAVGIGHDVEDGLAGGTKIEIEDRAVCSV